MTKRFFALLLTLSLALCTGCTMVLPANGTLSLDANDVKQITVKNAPDDTGFSVGWFSHRKSLAFQRKKDTMERDLLCITAL